MGKGIFSGAEKELLTDGLSPASHLARHTAFYFSRLLQKEGFTPPKRSGYFDETDSGLRPDGLGTPFQQSPESVFHPFQPLFSANLLSKRIYMNGPKNIYEKGKYIN